MRKYAGKGIHADHMHKLHEQLNYKVSNSFVTVQHRTSADMDKFITGTKLVWSFCERKVLGILKRYF